MKNPEMSIPDHLKTNEMCKNVVKRLPYLLIYLPDQFNT